MSWSIYSFFRFFEGLLLETRLPLPFQVRLPFQTRLMRGESMVGRKWMMEKLVFAWKYRWPIVRDKKYAIQSRSCWATGVHKCELLMDGGHTRVMDEAQFRFYHYHGTVSTRTEVCKEFATAHDLVVGEDSFAMDDTMAGMAAIVRQFQQPTTRS